MSSLGGILSIANSGIAAAQAGIQVTSHNLANAAVDGYTRQMLVLQAGLPVKMAEGYTGTGVRIQGYTRPRDALLDDAYRRENSVKSEASTRHEVMSQAESALADLTDAGLSGSLESFYDAWSDLATSPVGGSQREIVRERGIILARRLNDVSSRLTALQESLKSSLTRDIQDFNDATTQIAQINAKIVSAEAGNFPANDLRDERDRLIDKLSTVAGIEVRPADDGGMTILASGNPVVDGANAAQVQAVALGGGKYAIAFSGLAGNFTLSGGKIGADLDCLNNRVSDLMKGVDDIAGAVVTTVNGIHETGTNAAGATNVDFFDPTGLSASSIKVSAAVLASTDNVMAGVSGNAGDGGVAQQLADLRFTPQAALGGETIADKYSSLPVSVGLQVDNAQTVVDAQDAVLSQISSRRSSQSDVSVEEELMNLMKYQQAFSASARIVTTTNDLMNTLISM